MLINNLIYNNKYKIKYYIFLINKVNIIHFNLIKYY